MITPERLYGGSEEVSFATDYPIDLEATRVWIVTPTAVNKFVDLPDARTLPVGGIVGFVAVRSGSNSVALRDAGGTAVTLSTGSIVLPAGKACTLSLLDNSTAAGIWAGKVEVVSFATELTLDRSSFFYAGS